MHVIGLTGGIATGKSTVSELLQAEGAIVIDADQVAREILAPGQPAWQDTLKTFGAEILAPGGEIDRQKLGRIVFADTAARERLNAITHPRIESRIKELLDRYRQEGVAVVVLEAALLLEAGLTGYVDEIWVTDLPREEQVKRLMSRDGFPREEAEQRVDSQISPSARRAAADVLIDTNVSRQEVARKVRELWREMKQRLEPITPAG